MVVGVARLTFSIPGAGSLKDKRQVLRKLLDRVRARFNVAAAEVGDNDLWQRARVGLAVVGNERGFVDQSLDTILRYVDELSLAPLVDREVELISMSDLGGGMRTLAEAEWASGDDPEEPE